MDRIHIYIYIYIYLYTRAASIYRYDFSNRETVTVYPAVLSITKDARYRARIVYRLPIEADAHVHASNAISNEIRKRLLELSRRFSICREIFSKINS